MGRLDRNLQFSPEDLYAFFMRGVKASRSALPRYPGAPDDEARKKAMFDLRLGIPTAL
jgi:hypothetical protein